MIVHSRLVVGLISGTSMDGIDAALVRITGPGDGPRTRLLAFTVLPYPPEIRQRLMHVAAGQPAMAAEISELNFILGELFGNAAIEVCRRGGVPLQRITAIGSHGQTIFHEGGFAQVQQKPKRGKARPGAGSRASTLQIGEPAVIAALTGATVVANFRTADMAAGGQGAPLVPLVDYLLLGDHRLGTVALNIGGIANFTVIPARARPEDVVGFDTGPGNMVMDALMRHATDGRKSFDRGGGFAAQGKVLQPVLDKVMRLPYFRRTPPKSAGREQFGADFVRRYFLKRRGVRPADLICTATELTARTVATSLQRFVCPGTKIDRLIVSGGGAHNGFLLQRLQALLPGISVHISDDFGLPVDAKEAIAFAVLADRTIHGLAGNLPSVTGARRSVILGSLTQG
ncbi:MAG TPA: anhydro-N-acetylmuramic acid kinase [Terriglobia bacterium]|nr:anhydro-N-acetylmuramic acid kinase [Terriglobia bacterium]